MPRRRGVPRPSTVEGTLRVLARRNSAPIHAELDRLLAYWPAFHSRVLVRAQTLPRPHFLEVLTWILDQPAEVLPVPVPSSPARNELDSSSDFVVINDGYSPVENA